MKKIFLMFVAICAFAACDPTHEKINNDGHITADELKAKSSVTVDIAPDGKTGNVVTCTTSAPVNAKWTIAGKNVIGNYAWKKMKLGEHIILLSGLCADGTVVTAEFPISCQEITNPLEKYYIYQGEPFTISASGDAAPTRFSDNEGKHWPYLTDEVYFGKKTLIFEILEAKDGEGIWGKPFGSPLMRVMTGWWDPVFADDVDIPEGLMELPITDDIANACAQGGDGKDLNLLLTRGTVTFGDIYYEE